MLGRDINGISKKCLQSCELLTLESSISSRPVGNSADLWQIARKLIKLCKKPNKLFDMRYKDKMNCNEVNRILEDIQNTEGSVYHDIGIFRPNITNQEEKIMKSFLVEYAKENMITLKIFFRDSYYTKMKRDVAISKVTFVSNTGGLLGLCLGLSFVSIFEIFYHLIQVFSCKPSQNVDSIFPSQNQV